MLQVEENNLTKVKNQIKPTMNAEIHNTRQILESFERLQLKDEEQYIANLQLGFRWAQQSHQTIFQSRQTKYVWWKTEKTPMETLLIHTQQLVSGKFNSFLGLM